MIETIFYFANSAAEYNQNKSELSARTISFVPNGDGTGKIYKNGVQYGGAITHATSSELGGIKIGYTPNGNNYPVRLDNQNRAYVNVPSTGGGGGTTTIENRYDDSELRGLISDLNNDLNTLANNIDEDAINTLKRTIDEYEKIMEEFGAGYNGGIPFEWNDDLKAFIQQVINTDADGNHATWSTLVQRADEIEARVQNVERNTTITVNGEDTTLEALISNLHLYIDEATGTAIANLKTEWALTDEDLRKIKWLTSGFSSETTSTDSFAALYSRGQNDLSNAIATAKTEVIQQADGKYVAKSELASRVNEQLAGVYVEANDQKALASLVANAGKDANGNPIDAAGIIVEAINNGGTNVQISADKIALSGSTLTVDVTNLKIDTDYAFNTTDLGGTTITYGDYLLSEILLNDLTTGKVYLAKNKFLIGTNGESFDLGGIIGAGIVAGGRVISQSTWADVVDARAIYGQEAIYGTLYPSKDFDSYYIKPDQSCLRNLTVKSNLTADKITLGGVSITEWPSGTASGKSTTIEALDGTYTFTNGVLSNYEKHNRNIEFTATV